MTTHGPGHPQPRRGGVALTAEAAAEILRAAGMRGVEVTSEAPAGRRARDNRAGEGLRIVAGSDPVRMRYAIPPGDDGAASRGATGPPLEPGDSVIDISAGSMVCGYCSETVTWPDALSSWVTLTGAYLLGALRETRELVVLAEATTPADEPTILPYHCTKIPDTVRAEYADDILAAT